MIGLSRRRSIMGASLAATLIRRARAAPTYLVNASLAADGKTPDDNALDAAIAAAVTAVTGVQGAITTNQYFRGGVTLQLPPGPILLTRPHVIPSAHITLAGAGPGPNNTVLLKLGDFGTLIDIRDARTSQNIGNCAIVNLSAVDIGATSYGALFKMTGCDDAMMRDVSTQNGFIGVQFDGVSNSYASNLRCQSDVYFGQTQAQAARGEIGAFKPGSALISLVQSIDNVPNSNLHLSHITATGSDASHRLTAEAIRIESADVVLIENAEIGAVVHAGIHIAVSGTGSVQNVQTKSIEFDNGASYGLLVDGRTTGALIGLMIEGRFYSHEINHILLDSPNLAFSTFRPVGLGALQTPVVVAQGTGIIIENPSLTGFGSAATRPHQYCGIDIRTSNVTVAGGRIEPYGTKDLAYAVRLADGVTGCSVTNTVSAPGPTAFGAVRCTDLRRNHIAGNQTIGGAPEMGVL